jgi:hypothetical protein
MASGGSGSPRGVRFTEVPQARSEYDELMSRYEAEVKANKRLRFKLDNITAQFEYFKASLAEENPDLTKEKIELLQQLNQYKMDIAAFHRQISRLEQLLIAQGGRSLIESGEVEFGNSVLIENEELKI